MTARKQTEIDSGHAAIYLQSFLHNSDLAIIATSESQKITLFNDGAEKIFGYTRHEIIGKPLELLIPKESRKAHRQHIQHFGQGATASRKMSERAMISGLRKDGTLFPAEASIARTAYQGKMVFTVILQDTTERKQAEEALEQSEKKYRQLIELAQEGIWVIDADSNTTFVNPRMAEMLGYDTEEMQGKHLYSFPGFNY